MEVFIRIGVDLGQYYFQVRASNAMPAATVPAPATSAAPSAAVAINMPKRFIAFSIFRRILLRVPEPFER